jgi:predicted metal-dependent phosphoesterase TrpH
LREMADLHTHTNASDGQYAPRDLVMLAQKAGIQCLAVTDHDTIDGVEEAFQAGKECGITVLRGVEFGAQEDRHMHILGLNLQAGCSSLEQLCQTLKDSRNQRKYRIVDFLEEKGIHIDLKEVEELAGGDVIARPHFAQILVRHGHVATTREAFDRYLDTDEYQRIERFKADAATCIASIHQAGGKAVLAHPYQLNFSDEKLEETVVCLKEAGLDGLECYYPKHTPDMVNHYLDLAKKYQLHVTGGSDFHGERVKPDIPLRPLPLELDWLFE